jgi:hypothetical protein
LGLYLDAAGDVNADGFADLLVPMPNYSPPGKSNVGAALIYFGAQKDAGHIGAGFATSGTPYTAIAPSPSSTCESSRCAPYLLIPEFATEPAMIDNQAWLVSGGFVLRPKTTDTTISLFKFFDYGTRNTGSQDLTLKSSDLLMAPRKGTPYQYKSSYDHLGGLSVWY